MKIGLFYGTTSAATQEDRRFNSRANRSDCETEVFDLYEQDLNKMSRI